MNPTGCEGNKKSTHSIVNSLNWSSRLTEVYVVLIHRKRRENARFQQRNSVAGALDPRA